MTQHPPISLRPRPTLTFPKIAWVPRDTSLFNREGMGGWFDQSYKLVGSLSVEWEWWYMPLQCRLTSPGLAELCEYHKVKQWALKGASLADSLGRGEDTHTQELSQFTAMC